jgi:hypothetical protein
VCVSSSHGYAQTTLLDREEMAVTHYMIIMQKLGASLRRMSIYKYKPVQIVYRTSGCDVEFVSDVAFWSRAIFALRMLESSL